MIAKLLDDDLRKEQDEHDKRERSGKWTPSSFGQCYRRQVWKRRKVEETDKPDIETLRVFRAGKVFHQMIQRLLPEHKTEMEVNLNDIHGFADIVLDDMVVDIKSQKGFAFKLMEKNGFDIVEEKWDHILQVCTYAWILDKPKAMLVYVNKDTLEIREFEFNVNDFKLAILKEVETLNKFWKEEFDPPASPRLYHGKECGYCQFETKCKGKVF